MSDNPKVTVLMSVYNGERFLKDSIESILNQTYRNLEFLIIDDSSTDETPKILRKYYENYKRIKIIKNKKRMGLTKSLNKGLKFARGEYIARQDADDISMPTRLQVQVNFLDENPGIGAVGINSLIIDKNGDVIGRFHHPITHQHIMAKILTENRLVHGSVMFRKEILKYCGSFNEAYIFSQDYDLWLRISQIAKLANINEPLHLFRQSGESVTSLHRKKQKESRDIIRKNFIQKHSQKDARFLRLIFKNFMAKPTDALLYDYLMQAQYNQIGDRLSMRILKIQIRLYLTLIRPLKLRITTLKRKLYEI